MKTIIRENYRHLGVVTHPVLHEMLDALEVIQSPNLVNNKKVKIHALNKVIICIKNQSNLLDFEDVLISLEDILADLEYGVHLIWEEDLINIFYDIVKIETGEEDSLLKDWEFNSAVLPNYKFNSLGSTNLEVKTLIKQWQFKQDEFKEYEEY